MEQTNAASKKLLDKQTQIIVEIRRNIRNQIVSKKRLANTLLQTQLPHQPQIVTMTQQQPSIQDAKSDGVQTKQKKSKARLRALLLQIQKRFENALTMIRNGDDNTIIQGVKEIRKLLCMEEHAPIQSVIDYGLIPLFIQLANSERQPLRTESAWILLNMCSGNEAQVRYILEKGILALLAQFLTFSNLRLIEDAVWSFGNIIAEPPLIPLVISSPIIESIIEVVGRIPSVSLLKNAAWSFSNLFRNGAALSNERLRKIIELLVVAWRTTSDSEVLYYEILWGLSNVAHTEAAQSILMDETILQKFVEIIASNDETKKISVFRILSRLCNTKKNSEIVFREKMYFLLNDCLGSEESRVRLEALHLAKSACSSSNIVVNNLANNEIFMKHLTKMSEYQEQKHLMNICAIFKSFSSQLPFKTAVSVFAVHQLMRSFALFLNNNNSVDLLTEAMQSLISIFQVYEQKKNNPFIQMFNSNGGVQILESLQAHDSDNVYSAALGIIERFYDIDTSLK